MGFKRLILPQLQQKLEWVWLLNIVIFLEATRIDVNGFLMQNDGFRLIDSIKRKNNDYNDIPIKI